MQLWLLFTLLQQTLFGEDGDLDRLKKQLDLERLKEKLDLAEPGAEGQEGEEAPEIPDIAAPAGKEALVVANATNKISLNGQELDVAQGGGGTFQFPWVMSLFSHTQPLAE